MLARRASRYGFFEEAYDLFASLCDGVLKTAIRQAPSWTTFSVDVFHDRRAATLGSGEIVLIALP